MYKKGLIFKGEHIFDQILCKSKAVIDVSLKESDNGLILIITGDIRVKDVNHSTIEHTSGQNSDSLREWFFENEKAKRVADVWDRYSNNDLKAGTPKQSEILRKAELEGKSIDYVNALEILKDANLESDNGYKYGSQWLFEEIPQEIIDEIKLEW